MFKKITFFASRLLPNSIQNRTRDVLYTTVKPKCKTQEVINSQVKKT